MITTLMLYSLAVGLVLGGGAYVADLLVRRSAVATRWTYAGALALLVVLTLSAPWRAKDVATAVAERVSPSHVEADRSLGARFDHPSMQPPQTPAHARMFAPAVQSANSLASRVSPKVDHTLGVAWATASALLLVGLAAVWHRLVRVRRRWPRAVMHGISVRVSRNTVPAVYGVFAPEIVIPAEALRMLPRDQQLLLAHEREHVHARDPLLLAASAVVVALLPWHPVAWWLASRVRLSVELDCDARVLRAGGSRRVYGDLLLTFAQRTRGAGMPIGVSALFDSRSPLERRLLAMAQRQSPARANVAAAVFVAAAVTLVACTSPVPDAPESEPSALFLAIDSRDLLTGESIFTIDGQPATLSQAYALKRSEVASVFIDRSPNDSTFRRITMKTRPAGSPEPQQLLIAGWDRRISRDSIIAARARRDIDRAR